MAGVPTDYQSSGVPCDEKQRLQEACDRLLARQPFILASFGADHSRFLRPLTSLSFTSIRALDVGCRPL